ncbi:MAG TPA: phosphorylated adapter RNA export RNA-binding domain-containing protein [Polyangiaceae bacterium]|nr:phosphorylated adapter RNA export RNA-binding domain-containing protein [Polyangiaceae bacterium]
MPTEDTVSAIAKALSEVEEQPLTQITGVVKVLGDQVSLALLEETQRIEQSGGMLLPDNSRRRTAGGVFFFLARQKLSHEDKVAIFRPVKPAKPAQPAPEANRFPRRRVIEVAPSREPSRPRPGGGGGGFIPPGLPLAAKRVRARESIQNAIAALPPDDQSNLLLEVLAELYERRGVRIPEAAAPSSSRMTSDPLAAPPPSQRPIPVPIPPVVAAPVAIAVEPVREEPPSSEPAPKRAAATRARSTGTTRTTTKKRA